MMWPMSGLSKNWYKADIPLLARNKPENEAHPYVSSPQLFSRWDPVIWTTKAVVRRGKMRVEQMAGFANRKRLNERPQC